MADLTRFIAPDARTGGKFDVYVASIRVGSGDFLKVEPLSVRITGGVGGPFPMKGTVAITMPDTAPRGTCTVVLDATTYDGCAYFTDGGTLVIDTPVTQLRLQDNDRSYSWVQAKGIWGGLWTTSARFEDEFLADAPAGEAAPAAAGD